MGLPQPKDVDAVQSLPWDANHIEHAELFLRGLSRALRGWAVTEGASDAEKWVSKAEALELEADGVAEVWSRHPDGCAGAEFSTVVCTMLACEGLGDLARLLGVPLRVAAAGRKLIDSMALELVPDVGGSSHA